MYRILVKRLKEIEEEDKRSKHMEFMTMVCFFSCPLSFAVVCVFMQRLPWVSGVLSVSSLVIFIAGIYFVDNI